MMFAIDEELRQALMNVVGRLPTQVGEGMAAGLRGAEPIPKPMADALKMSAHGRAIETLETKLAELKESDGTD